MAGYNQPNPYDAPPVVHETKPTTESPFSYRTVSLLQRTRPWALFIGIVSFIGCGFCFLGALAVLFTGMQYSRYGGPGIPMIWMALIYGLAGFVALIMGITCVRYGTRIRQFVMYQTQDRLDHALDAQLGYWRLLGIITIIYLSIFALAFVVGLVSAASGPRFY